MWLILGVALALVYLLITNQSRKRKADKKKIEPNPQGKQPIVPVRWTPNLTAEADQEAEMARLSASKEPYAAEVDSAQENAAEVDNAQENAAEASDAQAERAAAGGGREDRQDAGPLAEPAAGTAAELLAGPSAGPSAEKIEPPAVEAERSGAFAEFEEELEVAASSRSYVRPEEVIGEEQIHSLWEAGRALEKLAGSPPRPFMTFDFGRRKFPQAQSVLTDEDSARGWVDALQERLDGELVAFIGTTRSQEEGEQGVEVVVARGETPLDILRLAQTDAANYDLSTEDIVTKLKELDRRYGIRIYAAQTDSVGFELRKQPADPRAFAEELYAFCPDLVDQGVGSVEQLAEYLKDHRDLHLWWD